jgi:hypothetical protein
MEDDEGGEGEELGEKYDCIRTGKGFRVGPGQILVTSV